MKTKVADRFLWVSALCLIMAVFAGRLDAKVVFRVPFQQATLEESFRVITDSLRNIGGDETVEIEVSPGTHHVGRTIEIKPDGHSILIKGNRRRPPVISGLVPLEGRIQETGDACVFVPADGPTGRQVSLLFIDGEPYTRVKEPAMLDIVRTEDLGSDGQGRQRYKLFLSPDQFRQIAFSGEDEPIAVITRKWVTNRWEVVEVNGEESALTICGSPAPGYNPISTSSFLSLENVASGIGSPGEWSMDREGRIHSFPVGKSVQEARLAVPGLNTLFHIHGSEGDEAGGITFQNLCFEGTGIEDLYRRDAIEQASNGLSAAIEADHAKEIRISDCTFRGISNNGVWFRRNCHDSGVSKSSFLQMGAGAVKIGCTDKKENDLYLTSHIEIRDNRIRGYGRIFKDAVGIIVFNAADNVISHNEISEGCYSGISLGWTWGYSFSPTRHNEVSFNHVHDIGDGTLSDMGGIYHLGDASETSIHHNLIHDVRSPFDNAWGIYADEGTSRLLVEENLVYNCTSGGFHQHYGQQNVVRNNVFAFNDNQQVTITTIKEKESLSFYSNVLVTDNGSFYSGVGINSESVRLDDNCYWSTGDGELTLSGLPLEKWISAREPGSRIIDPKLRNGQRGVYAVKNRRALKTIGFKEFSIRDAGPRARIR